MDIIGIEEKVDNVLSKLYIEWVMTNDSKAWEKAWKSSCQYVRRCVAEACRQKFCEFKDTSVVTEESSICSCKVWLYLAAVSSLAEFQDFLKNFKKSEHLGVMKAVCFLLNEAQEKYVQASKGDEEAWDRFIFAKRKMLKDFDFDKFDCQDLKEIINKRGNFDERVFAPKGNMNNANLRLSTLVNYKSPEGSIKPVELFLRGMIYEGEETLVKCWICSQPTPIAEGNQYNDKSKLHKDTCEMNTELAQLNTHSNDKPTTSIHNVLPTFILSSTAEETNHLIVEVLLKYVRSYICRPLNTAVEDIEKILFNKCKKISILEKDVDAFFSDNPRTGEGYDLIATIVGRFEKVFKNPPKREDIEKRSNPVVWTKPGGCWEICKTVMFNFSAREFPGPFTSSFKMDEVYYRAEDFSVDALLKLLVNLKHPLVEGLNTVDKVRACSIAQNLIGMRNLTAHRILVNDGEVKACFHRALDLFNDERFFKEAKKYPDSQKIIDDVLSLQGCNQEEFKQFYISLFRRL